jgi:hypothetical protein
MDMYCVMFEASIYFLNIIQMNFGLKSVEMAYNADNENYNFCISVPFVRSMSFFPFD